MNGGPVGKSRIVFVCCMLIIVAHAAAAAGSEEYVYQSRGKRDPFLPLVGKASLFNTRDLIDVVDVKDVKLEGIMYDAQGGSRAILNGTLLKEGDEAGLIKVEKIEAKKVIVIINEERHEVSIGKGDQGG